MLSLAANAALLAVIQIRDPGILRFDRLWGARRPAALPVPVPVAPSPSASAILGPGSADQLLRGDARTVIARLRAAGFPRAVIRAIAQAKVDELLHAREMEIAARMRLKPYWQARYSDFDQHALADMRATFRERSKMVEDLIGTDPSDTNPLAGVFVEGQRGGLGPDAYRKVAAINSDYDEMRQAIYADSAGALMPEDKEKLAFLEKQQAADLAAALGPQELLEYQLNTSPAASMLRNTLAAFNPTEEEFRAIYRAQQDVNAQLGLTDGPLTSEQLQARQAGQLAAVQQVLSPERFADYKAETDPTYLGVDRVVQQFNLPPGTTQQVAAMQADYTQQVAAINSDSQISPADKATQLAALADAATAKLTAALGPRGFYVYQQSVGSWLKTLTAEGK